MTCKGMPVIAIEDINEYYATLDTKQFDLNDFCLTVYKYQEAEINEHYNIFDCIRMDKCELYT